jgi:DNA-binding NtrC family response regulator
MPPKTNTTIDRAETADTKGQVPSWALVILWSDSEPWRAGELAPLPGFETVIVGRQEIGSRRYAYFGRQRPGEPFAPSAPRGLLAGDGISREQLELRATAVDVEMKNIGRCPTLVNGTRTMTARLKEGDLLMLPKEVLLMCVRRPRTIEGPRALRAFGEPDIHGIVGETPVMWALRQRLALLALTDDFVLIQGESGTGKDLVALAIHRLSKRREGPWVPHNAANFTESLNESQLFGNLANYPNPGVPARPGLLGAADGGTLFLDEIGDCPLEVQAHLLRVLQTGEYQRLGETALRHVDMRVIGATNKPKQAFRTDFLARFPRELLIPPLRERREDIPLLIRHWVILRARKFPEVGRFLREGPEGMDAKLDGRLVEYIVRQPLELNYRALNDILADAVDASPGDELRLPATLAGSNTTPPQPPEPANGARARGPVSKPSKEELLACLESVGWNKSQAGEKLGLHRNRVRQLIEEYDLKRDETAS